MEFSRAEDMIETSIGSAKVMNPMSQRIASLENIGPRFANFEVDMNLAFHYLWR